MTDLEAKAIDISAAVLASRFRSDDPNADVGIILTALRSVRQEALEEAAQVADEFEDCSANADARIAALSTADYIAQAIRALKEGK